MRRDAYVWLPLRLQCDTEFLLWVIINQNKKILRPSQVTRECCRAINRKDSFLTHSDRSAYSRDGDCGHHSRVRRLRTFSSIGIDLFHRVCIDAVDIHTYLHFISLAWCLASTFIMVFVVVVVVEDDHCCVVVASIRCCSERSVVWSRETREEQWVVWPARTQCVSSEMSPTWLSWMFRRRVSASSADVSRRTWLKRCWYSSGLTCGMMAFEKRRTTTTFGWS